jgi:23S rRNA pseudouridine955/2504/2580 synthase
MSPAEKIPAPSTPDGPTRAAVSWLEVDENGADQRIDNFLVSRLKGVPKSHVYRILRSGEVRVNSKRIDASYRLQVGDRIRVPPVRVAERAESTVAPLKLAAHTVFEDDWLLAIDKPAGVAVHGGSGVSLGAIESLRRERPELRFLELVHRLDRDTSGLLLLAKKRSALVAMHALLREHAIEKRYLAMVNGKWKNAKQRVRLSLRKFLTGEGERRVAIDEDGQESETVFTLEGSGTRFSLLEAHIITGRTHQIRVHLTHLGFPILGDDKYGDFALNKALRPEGLKRMFLHSARMAFVHPGTGRDLTLEAPLPKDLAAFAKANTAPKKAAK